METKVSIDVRNAVHRMTQLIDCGIGQETAFKTISDKFNLTSAEMNVAEELLNKYKGLHDDLCQIRYGRECNCHSAAFKR